MEMSWREDPCKEVQYKKSVREEPHYDYHLSTATSPLYKHDRNDNGMSFMQMRKVSKVPRIL